MEKAQSGKLNTAEIHLMINGFDQAELYQYEQARELSITFLKEWLAKYKFKNWKTTRTRKVPVTDVMREERAKQIATDLNNTDRWHSHGHGISMKVLRGELNMKINDFGRSPALRDAVRQYQGLLDDYMARRGHDIVVQTTVEHFGLSLSEGRS
jgi:hypothetical protein